VIASFAFGDYLLNTELETPDIAMSEALSAAPWFLSSPSAEPHGQTSSGSRACCRRSSTEGIVDCSACLQDQSTILLGNLGEEDASMASDILSVLSVQIGEGIAEDQIEVSAVPDDLTALY
jgi:oxalate---CoA ligase